MINIVKDFLYKKESYDIRGACFEVWKTFRGIFKEKVVENALEEELKERGFKVESQKMINIYYKGKKIGSYTPDLIVNEVILIELKVKPILTKEDERQFWYYIRGSQYKLGFLINFGSQELEIKRRVYDKAREKYKQVSVNQRTHQRISASNRKNGFTLIEILVAVGVFSLISAIIFNVFNTGSRIKNKIFSSQNVRSEIQYAIELMGREIRMMQDISNSDAGTNDSEISFDNSQCRDVNYCLADADGTCDPVNGEYIARNNEVFTSSDVKIEKLVFYINNFLICEGALPSSNGVQPSITILIRASAKGSRYAQSPIEIGTTISPRFYPYSDDYCLGTLPCP